MELIGNIKRLLGGERPQADAQEGAVQHVYFAAEKKGSV